MTGERAKRFPLGLADLVREGRKSGSQRSDVRSQKASGLAKPATGVTKNSTIKTAAEPKSTVSSFKPAGKPRTVAAAAPNAAAPGRTPLAKPAPVKPRLATRPAVPTRKTVIAAPSVVTPKSSGAVLRPASSTVPGSLPVTNVANGSQQNAAAGAHALTSERVRERMVERLRANGIADPRVLFALSVVPRHLFVDPGLATQAYEDAALPIGHHQTISKPSVVARMIELAAAGRELSSVLEIGTGCGYQAAVLSRVARDVYSIERIKPLYERAKTNLRPLRIPNIRLHYGDGRLGLPSVAPFDAIVIAAAGLDVPQALLEQLAIGGRLVAPVGDQNAQAQVLTLVERVGPTQWRESRLDRVFFVPLKSGVI